MITRNMSPTQRQEKLDVVSVIQKRTQKDMIKCDLIDDIMSKEVTQ
jgi:hypothetical protein